MSRPALPQGHAETAAAPPGRRRPSAGRLARASGPPVPDRAPAGSAAGAAGRHHDNGGRRRALRALAVPAMSVIVYFAVRPAVGSDAAGLAIAGAVPAAYAIVAVLLWRRVELWAAATAAGYALGCLASLLAGGSPLPLKLHEAAVTFLLGVVLLGAALVRRPLPVSRVLKVPRADRAADTALSVMTGGFLVLHALLNLALALTLSTAAFLTAGRAVSWAALAVGALCLYGYLRRLRRGEAGMPPGQTSPPAREGRRP
jgi:hypothetical protein